MAFVAAEDGGTVESSAAAPETVAADTVGDRIEVVAAAAVAVVSVVVGTAGDCTEARCRGCYRMEAGWPGLAAQHRKETCEECFGGQERNILGSSLVHCSLWVRMTHCDWLQDIVSEVWQETEEQTSAVHHPGCGFQSH